RQVGRREVDRGVETRRLRLRRSGGGTGRWRGLRLKREIELDRFRRIEVERQQRLFDLERRRRLLDLHRRDLELRKRCRRRSDGVWPESTRSTRLRMSTAEPRSPRESARSTSGASISSARSAFPCFSARSPRPSRIAGSSGATESPFSRYDFAAFASPFASW